MKNYADSWIELNPEYEYRFLDDYDIIDFIKKDFPEYLECYKKLKHGASKADLWRYLIIYKNGGVYADMDCKCLTPLNQWIDPQAAFVTQLGINKDVCQWLIISVPQNPIFLRAAQKTLFNSENNNNTTSHFGFEYVQNKLVVNKNSPVMIFDHPVLGLSGPPVLQKAAEECFEEGTIEKILESTQIICVSDPINSCHMNGNVIHDTRNIKYKNTLKQLNIKHYNTRWERLKRKMKKFILSH
jgi:mannosyltransferase OCH1-like enzyme